MTSKSRIVSIKRIDKIARGMAKKAVKKKSPDEMSDAEKERLKRAERVAQRKLNQADYARLESQKIMDEMDTDIHPLVIDFKGEKAVVIDPNGIYAMQTTPFLDSDENMILTHRCRKAPEVLGVMDFETWGLQASIIHHGVFSLFEDDDKLLDERAYKDVSFFYSFDQLKSILIDTLAGVIEAHKADPSRGKTAKIYAHNGQNFDFVGFAISLGLDRNYDVEAQVMVGGKKQKWRISVDTFSNKSKITFATGQGHGYRLQLIDSAHLLPDRLKNLGGALAKGETPLQFTDPIKWINQKTRGNGKPFSLKQDDVAAFMVNAHSKSLEECKEDLSEEAYEGLQIWKNTIDDKEYSCADAVVLINALKRYARKIRQFSAHLGEMLGHQVVISIEPFSYNTISSAGFALSAAYWYSSRLEKDEHGRIHFKKYLTQNIKQYALVDRVTGMSRIIGVTEAEMWMSRAVPVQKHGIILPGVPLEVIDEKGKVSKVNEMVLIEQPIFTSALDNRFSKIAQNGSLTVVMQPIGRRIRKFDINSSFPAVMANGVKKKIKANGYDFINTAGQPDRVVPDTETVNALIGYEDPGNRCSRPTIPMIEFGLATKESMLNERGEEVDMWVVRGREKILQMLQFRNGEFTCILPPSTDPFLRLNPLIPIRTPGLGLDSRLINAEIIKPTMLLIRGEYLAAYAAYPTEDDEAMVVYLSEIKKGERTERHRSRHGPIVGVTCARDSSGAISIIGVPHRPHKQFMDMLFNTRLSEKKRAEKLARENQFDLSLQAKADSQITKLLMNGGSYGSYAQSNKPELDFNLSSFIECAEVIDRLRGLDPHWQGMFYGLEAIAKYINVDLDYDTCSWRVFDTAIEEFQAYYEKTAYEGSALYLQNIKKDWIKCMKRFFYEWAGNQLTQFTTYTYKSINSEGLEVRAQRGILITFDKTASHAIRPYPCAVLAKSAVALHEGQRSVWNSPFGLCYSDTDSLDLETGFIRNTGLTLEVMSLIGDEYKRRLGSEPSGEVGYRDALEIMMHQYEFDGIPASKPGNDKLVIDILKTAGLSISTDLGAWGIEETKYSPKLVFKENEEGEKVDQDGKGYVPYLAHYFAPKVYAYLDENSNCGAATVRSVPRATAIHPPLLRGFVIGTSSLGDRRGLSPQSLKKVNLNDTRRIRKAKNKHITVPSLLSNPRRIYPDEYSSKPFPLDISAQMEQQILDGRMFSAGEMTRNLVKNFSIDEGKTVIRGLELGLDQYERTVRVAGMSYFEGREKVKAEEIQATKLLKRIQELQDEKGIEEIPMAFSVREEGMENLAAEESIKSALAHLESKIIINKKDNNND